MTEKFRIEKKVLPDGTEVATVIMEEEATTTKVKKTISNPTENV